MKFIVEQLPDCRASMRVDVPAETVATQKKQIVKLFSQQAKIPGFRPGKVPSHVIEKRYAKEIADELKDRLVRMGCQEGIKKEGLDVINVTDIRDDEFIDGGFAFTAQLQTAPAFELPDYKNIPVSVPKVDVTEHDVDHQMDHWRQRLATFEDAEEGHALEMGDYAVLTFEGAFEGKPLAEVSDKAGYMAKGVEQWLRLDEQAFLPGFCEQLLGLKKDDKKEFDIGLPEEMPIEELKGANLTYNVEVKGVKVQVLPEWTDELAAKVAGDATVESLREQARAQLKAQQEQQRQSEMTTELIEYFDTKLEFELPEGVVASETQRQVNDLVQRGQSQGLSNEQLMEQQQDIFKHAATQAQVNVKTGFILQQIAEKEKIEATQDEILGQIAQMAHQSGTPIKKYIKHLQKADAIGQIANRIVTAKTLDFLRENANVTEVDRPPHECDNPDHQHHDHDHDDDKAPDEKGDDD